MLEKYKNQVPNFYNQISLAINSGRLSHAYLIEIENNDNYFDIIRALVIDILNIDGNKQIDYEKLIDNGSYADFFIIKPNDSKWIKKDQILSLQQKFKTKSNYNNKKIYVVDKADDLNIAACNTLLKFLEEPVDDVLAILLSNNHYNVLPTIFSRCQLIRLDVQKKDSNHSIQDKILEFLKLLYTKKDASIPYIGNFQYDFENRTELEKFVEELIKFYSDLSRFILKKSLLYYNDYEKEILEILKYEHLSSISLKILSLNELVNDLDFNVNSRLFMDKLIMILIGVDVDV